MCPKNIQLDNQLESPEPDKCDEPLLLGRVPDWLIARARLFAHTVRSEVEVSGQIRLVPSPAKIWLRNSLVHGAGEPCGTGSFARSGNSSDNRRFSENWSSTSYHAGSVIAGKLISLDLSTVSP